jgi:hypothetical protein
MGGPLRKDDVPQLLASEPARGETGARPPATLTLWSLCTAYLIIYNPVCASYSWVLTPVCARQQ